MLGFAWIACVSLLLENHIAWLSYVLSRSMVFADWMRLGWALVYASLSLVYTQSKPHLDPVYPRLTLV